MPLSTTLTLGPSPAATPVPEIAARLASLDPLVGLSEADFLFLAARGSVMALAEDDQQKLRRGEEDCVAVVLEGEIRDDQRVTPFGPGQTAGMEMLAAREALSQASRVRATQQSIVLLVPVRALRARAATAPAFAARLYKAALYALSMQVPAKTVAQGAVPAELELTTERMSVLLHDADAAAIQNDGVVPQQLQHELRNAFDTLVTALQQHLGDDSEHTLADRLTWGKRVQRTLLPYLLLTETSERLYAKPRGYAGDSISIDGIYANQARGHGRLGPLLDQCFLEQAAAKAVRNRRGLLCEEIQTVVHTHPERRVEITSMACGPAREVFDVLDSLDDPRRLRVNLIDLDQQALEQVRSEAEARGYSDCLRFHHANLVKLALGRQQLELAPQDLVYSIGLIDYFDNRLVTRLMSLAHSWLVPGSELILGNFHPRNPCKALMDYVLNWELIHRDEEEMDLLYQNSSFNRPVSRIRFEDEGVNLFASCKKEHSTPLKK